MTRPYFRSVCALPEYKLKIGMETGSIIVFDMSERLEGGELSALRDERLFSSVHTDGDYLLFGRDDGVRVRIGARELADMLLMKK